MNTTTDTIRFSGQFIGLAITGSLILFLVLFAMSVTGAMDADHEYNQQVRYCDMVESWKADAGKRPEHRAGWPDYRGVYDEMCGGK